jgi:hypothetical protein
MDQQINCPVCGNDKTHILWAVQGLNKDHMSVDIHSRCENDHQFLITYWSENGTQWFKVEEEK